jgi:hypothetical protein
MGQLMLRPHKDIAQLNKKVTNWERGLTCMKNNYQTFLICVRNVVYVFSSNNPEYLTF